MHYLHDVLNFILHLDHYLVSFISLHGAWVYLLVFAVIFCETGLVILPFLPGDSLLFTLGSIAAYSQNQLNIWFLLVLLITASTVGNYVNYELGRFIGPRVFSKKSKLLNKKYLEEAHQFYEKHGGKTIVMARFLPIIRTFVPFVAGVSYMSRHLFHVYNVSSAVLWIVSLLGMGYFLGSLPFIKENFTLVIYGIVLLSILPPFLTLVYQKIKPALSRP